MSAASWELIDIITGNTVASFLTMKEAVAVLDDLQTDEREDLILVAFDERGHALGEDL